MTSILGLLFPFLSARSSLSGCLDWGNHAMIKGAESVVKQMKDMLGRLGGGMNNINMVY